MSIPKISVSIPENLMSFVSLKVHHGGYGSVSEYFRELVRQDQKAEIALFNGRKQMAPEQPNRQSSADDRWGDRDRGSYRR